MPDTDGHVDWTESTVSSNAFYNCKELRSISLPMGYKGLTVYPPNTAEPVQMPSLSRRPVP